MENLIKYGKGSPDSGGGGHQRDPAGQPVRPGGAFVSSRGLYEGLV